MSKKRFKKYKNIEYLNIEIKKLNLKNNSLDFAYDRLELYIISSIQLKVLK